MLSIYDPYDEIFDFHPFYEVPLRLLASEILPEFGIKDENELSQIMEKAFEVCFNLHIPITDHFKKVFLYFDGQLVTDWLLSDLGSYLLLINGDTRNYKVARAQLYIVNQQEKRA